jgi:pimeloyl-ACP methyl ester carboxylesterase
VLEEPLGSESIDFDEISRGVEADIAARAREAPEAHKRDQLEENPTWSEGDSAANVESLRDCDAEPLAAVVRNSLQYDLTTLVGSVAVPALLVLGSEARGSALPKPERTDVADALRRGKVKTFDAGHRVHWDDFEGYVRLLSNWLKITRV